MNENLKVYQDRVASILQRDYFPKEKGWVIQGEVVNKNNNVKLSAITIRKDKNVQIAPAIYVNHYYDNGYSEEAAAQSIYEVYQHSKEQQKEYENTDLKSIMDFKSVKDKICYKLVNAKKNQEAMAYSPYLPVTEDLMLSFYIQCREDATIAVNNKLVELWGIDKTEAAKQLYLLADDNMQRIHPVTVKSMVEILREIMPDAFMSVDECAQDEFPLYVVTNDRKLYGAAVVAYDGGNVLQDCLEKMNRELGRSAKGIYILPSSTHELLLIPEDKNIDIQSMRAMVMEVNSTEVEETDKLSDNVFYYDKANGFKQLTFDSREISR